MGFALPRWWGILDVILEKDSGKPRIDKFRIIQLMEADLNYALKFLWGKSLAHKEKTRIHTK